MDELIIVAQIIDVHNITAFNASSLNQFIINAIGKRKIKNVMKKHIKYSIKLFIPSSPF